MKIACFLVLSVVCTMFMGCFTEDDLGRYVNLNITDAIVLENRGNYVVGDTIFLELKFSRYLDEEGQTNKLDIFESSSSESFSYYFEMSKFSKFSDSFQPIFISPDFVFAEEGSVDGSIFATAVLNANQDSYESRIGIVLAEAGRFRFNLDYFSIQNDNYVQDKVQIGIQHNFSDGAPNSEFEVTE